MTLAPGSVACRNLYKSFLFQERHFFQCMKWKVGSWSLPALTSSTFSVCFESRAGLILDGDSGAVSLLLRLSALIWRFKSRGRFSHFFSA